MHLVRFWPSPTSIAGGNTNGGHLERGGGSERNGPFLLCTEGFDFRVNNDPFLASFDTTPSPHERINAPRSLLAFAHIHSEAGTPTEGVGSAVVGRNGPFLCAEGFDFRVK
jgi:hypothetical protein